MKYLKIVAVLLFLFACISINAQTKIDSFCTPNVYINTGEIFFSLPDTEAVSFEIYNRWGNDVLSPLNDTVLPPGHYTIKFNIESLPAGTYDLRFVSNGKGGFAGLVTILSQSTALEELEIANTNPNFYPNPTNDVLNLTTEGDKIISIYDINGRICKVLTTSATAISMGDLIAGPYIVNVLSNESRFDISQPVIKSANPVR